MNFTQTRNLLYPVAWSLSESFFENDKNGVFHSYPEDNGWKLDLWLDETMRRRISLLSHYENDISLSIIDNTDDDREIGECSAEFKKQSDGSMLLILCHLQFEEHNKNFEKTNFNFSEREFLYQMFFKMSAEINRKFVQRGA